MTPDNLLSQMGLPPKLTERYAEYSGVAHEQPIYYPYEPSHAQGHIMSSKHHYSGGGSHKSNAALSALTLLAFLFFLHILQQCLRDHMTAMSSPQVMIMTGGREGEENIAKVSRTKLDKAGLTDADIENKNANNKDATEYDNSEKFLTKITTSEHVPWKNPYKHFVRHGNQSLISSDFFNAAR